MRFIFRLQIKKSYKIKKLFKISRSYDRIYIQVAVIKALGHKNKKTILYYKASIQAAKHIIPARLKIQYKSLLLKGEV